MGFVSEWGPKWSAINLSLYLFMCLSCPRDADGRVLLQRWVVGFGGGMYGVLAAGGGGGGGRR